MASSKFDELTKVLATSTSRRQTIKVLFASILGGTLGFGGIGAAQAEGNCDQSPSTDLCGNPTDNFGIWHDKIKGCVHSPGTCTGEVDPSHIPPQWVLLHEDNKPNYTLFAGQRRKGIECPKILRMNAPNYWEFAWDAAKKHLKGQVKAGKIGLAINSRAARTECQLHIHVSCIQTGVRTQLDGYYKSGHIAPNPASWNSKKYVRPLKYTVNGSSQTRTFRLLYLKNLNQNLFQLLFDNVVSPNSEDMAEQTLVVTERPGGGFYILNSMDPSSSFVGTGFGEGLLDETCS